VITCGGGLRISYKMHICSWALIVVSSMPSYYANLSIGSEYRDATSCRGGYGRYASLASDSDFAAHLKSKMELVLDVLEEALWQVDDEMRRAREGKGLGKRGKRG
jgi:hypothetical protein